MKTIKDLKKFKEKSSAIAIGTFDGLHLGHKKVIESAVALGKTKKIPSVVLTFDPHPQISIRPEKQIKLLSNIEERECLIGALRPDYLVIARFDKHFRNMTPKSFVKDILIKKLKVQHVFVGKDYAFGQGKKGNLTLLKRLGKELDFVVTGVADKKETGKIVKSTLIRGLLEGGKFSHAVNLLGHPYLICGKVVKGRGRGALLGYPTANISVESDKLLPKDGVYACHFIVKGKKHPGVVNIGKRPTFAEKDRTIEVYILSFRGMIRGQKVCILIEKRIRDEKKFLSIRALQEKMASDVKIAKKILIC